MASSIMAGAAYAEAGPFWHHREKGGKGAGEKIEEKSPEKISGKGGAQTLTGKIATEPVEITSTGQQVKGTIYNTNLQGQAKVEMTIQQPTLVKPALKGCTVTVGENNRIRFFISLLWTWNGTQAQLEGLPQILRQTPDGIAIGVRFGEGEEALPKATFTTISLKGAGCGVLAGTFPVEGSVAATEFKPEGVEVWSITLIIKYGGGRQQHFWNGSRYVGVTTGLLFAKNEANLVGEGTIETEKQEVAVFEK